MVSFGFWFKVCCNANINVIYDEEKAHCIGLKEGIVNNRSREGRIGFCSDEFGDHGAD